MKKKIKTKKKNLRNYKINHNIDIEVFLNLIYPCVFDKTCDVGKSYDMDWEEV